MSGRGRGRDATLPAWLSNGTAGPRPPGPPGPPRPPGPPPTFQAAPGRPVDVASHAATPIADAAAEVDMEIEQPAASHVVSIALQAAPVHSLAPEVEMEIEQQADQQVLQQQEAYLRSTLAQSR